MSVKCEQPLDKLTVQVWLLYDHPNFKYCTLFASGTELRTDGHTNGQTDGWTDRQMIWLLDSPDEPFPAGGIKTDRQTNIQLQYIMYVNLRSKLPCHPHWLDTTRPGLPVSYWWTEGQTDRQTDRQADRQKTSTIHIVCYLHSRLLCRPHWLTQPGRGSQSLTDRRDGTDGDRRLPYILYVTFTPDFPAIHTDWHNQAGAPSLILYQNTYVHSLLITQSPVIFPGKNNFFWNFVEFWASSPTYDFLK